MAMLPEVFKQTERTRRWWVSLPITVAFIVLVAAFSYVSSLDTATWEPYGIGGFIATITLGLTIYRMFLRGDGDQD